MNTLLHQGNFQIQALQVPIPRALISLGTLIFFEKFPYNFYDRQYLGKLEGSNSKIINSYRVDMNSNRITELENIVNTQQRSLESQQRVIDALKCEIEAMKHQAGNLSNQMKACYDRIRIQESVYQDGKHKRRSLKKWLRRLRSDDFWKEILHRFFVSTRFRQ